MSFGPTTPKPGRSCPACQFAVPLATLKKCPACGASLDAPGDPGKALVEAMTDVLGDPLGKKRDR